MIAFISVIFVVPQTVLALEGFLLGFYRIALKAPDFTKE